MIVSVWVMVFGMLTFPLTEHWGKFGFEPLTFACTLGRYLTFYTLGRYLTFYILGRYLTFYTQGRYLTFYTLGRYLYHR